MLAEEARSRNVTVVYDSQVLELPTLRCEGHSKKQLHTVGVH